MAGDKVTKKERRYSTVLEDVTNARELAEERTSDEDLQEKIFLELRGRL